MNDNVQLLLQHDPFTLKNKEKKKLFMAAIQQQAQWHFDNNPEYKSICENADFDPYESFNLEKLPYLPVSLFKKFDLVSVPEQQIIKTLYSSSTSGQPSKIMLDKTTSAAQVQALTKIMQSYIGQKRMNFLIFDSSNTVKSVNESLNSRGTAIRGLLGFASRMKFVLSNDLELDKKSFIDFVDETPKDTPICIFGFTWLIYSVALKNKTFLIEYLKQKKFTNVILLHLGGWKKLTDLMVSKEEFNIQMRNVFNLHKGKVIDFYGMTEQLGTVYPDCEYGFKHMPLYSELIIRSMDTLEPAQQGEAGFIQLISPIPHSYPGISLLSDDIGKIVGIDNCKCGRMGTYFTFVKRSEKAELKGCGDSLTISI